MNNLEDAQILQHLGLTASQIKVYLALLRLRGASKGTTIAKFAGVPRQDVYRLLNELQDLGIIQKTLATPAKFRNVSPQEAVDILLQRKIGDFDALKEQAQQFVERTELIANEIPLCSEEQQFVLITEREAIINKMKEEMDNMQHTADCIVSISEALLWFDVLSESVEAMLCRGLSVRWIIELPDANQLPKHYQTYLKYPNFKIKYLSGLHRAKCAIFDDRDLLLNTFTGAGFAHMPSLWSNNPSLVAIAGSYFENCWKNVAVAKPETKVQRGLAHDLHKPVKVKNKLAPPKGLEPLTY